MSEAPDVELEDLERAVEVVQSHPCREKLAALAYEMLSRQAESKRLFQGKRQIGRKGDRHGVRRADAQTDLGNLHVCLDRGPRDARERLLVSAFAVAGFERLASGAQGEARQHCIERFVAHSDWLEMASPYVVYPLVDRLLGASLAGAYWEALADGLGEPAQGVAGLAKLRARDAARLTGLAQSGSPAARQALARIRSQGGDAWLLAWTGDSVAAETSDHARTRASTPQNEVLGEGELQPGQQISGSLGAPSRRPWSAALRWASGWALLTWMVKGLAAALGLRRVAEVKIAEGRLHVRRRMRLLGRTVRKSEEAYPLHAVLGVGRNARYPLVHLLVGLVCLCAGVLAGGVFAHDGLYTGDVVLLYLAVGFVGIGALLDLLLDTLWSGARQRVAVQIWIDGPGQLCLHEVPLEQARAFVEHLAERLEIDEVHEAPVALPRPTSHAAPAAEGVPRPS